MTGARRIFYVFLAYYGITCFSDVYFVFGPYYERMGASPRAAGLFLSIFYMAMIMCRPLGSMAMERIGAQRTLIVSSSLAAVSGAGIALLPHSEPLLLMFRFISGLSVSVFVVAIVAYQSMLLDKGSRGLGFALFTTGSLLPLATVVPFCEWLQRAGYYEFYSWLPVLIALACVALACGVREVRSASSSKEAKWGSYRDMLKVQGITALLLTALVMSVADGMTICVAYLAQDRFVPASWFLVFEAAAGIIVRTAAYRFVAWLPRPLLAASASALMGFALFGLSFASSSLMFAIFGILFGVGIGIGFPTYLSLVGDLAPVKFYPKATGSLLLAIDFGWMASPLIFGYISPVFSASGTFRAAGLLIFAVSFVIHFKLWVPLWKKLERAG